MFGSGHSNAHTPDEPFSFDSQGTWASRSFRAGCHGQSGQISGLSALPQIVARPPPPHITGAPSRRRMRPHTRRVFTQMHYEARSSCATTRGGTCASPRLIFRLHSSPTPAAVATPFSPLLCVPAAPQHASHTVHPRDTHLILACILQPSKRSLRGAPCCASGAGVEGGGTCPRSVCAAVTIPSSSWSRGA